MAEYKSSLSPQEWQMIKPYFQAITLAEGHETAHTIGPVENSNPTAA